MTKRPGLSMDKTKRQLQLNVRLSEEESARLCALCAHFGLDASSLLRMLVKTKHDELANEARERATR